MKNKNYFKFDDFRNLTKGDVFKFSPIIDNDIPSKFYTVYYKDNMITKCTSTYGHKLYRIEMDSNTIREVMIYPDRKNT